MGNHALVGRMHFLSPEKDEVFRFQLHNEKKLGSSGYSVQFYRNNRGQDPELIKSTGRISVVLIAQGFYSAFQLYEYRFKIYCCKYSSNLLL